MGRVHVVHGLQDGLFDDFTVAGVSENPVACLVVATTNTSLDTVANSDIEFSIGVFDGTNYAGISHYSEDGQTTTDAKKIAFTDAIIKWPQASSSSVDLRATAAFISGGVRITYGVEASTSYRVFVVLWFGSDLTAKVGTVAGGSVSTTTDVTSVGFEADYLITLADDLDFSTTETYQNNNTPAVSFVLNDGSETVRCMRWRDRTGQADSAAEMRCSSAWIFRKFAAPLNETKITAFLSNGFTASWEGPSGTAAGFGYLAIIGQEAAIGDARSTSDFSFSPGFRPGAILSLTTQVTGSSGWENTTEVTDSTAAAWGFGASTEFGEEGSMVVTSVDAAADSDTNQAIYDDSGIMCLTTGSSPTVDYEGGVTFDVDSVDVDMDANPGSDDRITCLVLETDSVSGTAALTLQNVESAAVGIEDFTGTSALVLDAQDLDAVGLEIFTGTSATTLPALDLDAVGIEEFIGTSATTLPNIELAAAGIVANPVTGTSAVDLPSIEEAAVGLEEFIGTGATTLPVLDLDAVGLEAFLGTSATTLPALDLDAVGIEEFLGTSAVVLPPVDADGSGGSGILGTSAMVLPVLDLDAVGLEEFLGTSAQVLPSLDLAAVGLEIFTGTGATALSALDLDAVGLFEFTGTGAVILPAQDLDAVGLEIFTGTSAPLLPALDLDASGTVAGAIAGNADLVLPSLELDAAGAEAFLGTSAVILRAVTMTSAGLVVEGITGTSVIVLPPLDLLADDEPHVFSCTNLAASYDGATELAASYDAETELGGSYC